MTGTAQALPERRVVDPSEALAPAVPSASDVPSAATSHRFRALDGWRGVSALLVALYHLDANSHLMAVTRNAYILVDFFFVLSGFVLTASAGQRMTSLAALRRFVGRRLRRLVPLHYFALAVFVLLAAWQSLTSHTNQFTGPDSPMGLLQSVALVQGFTTYQLAWNFPAWSVSIELWLSIVFAVILYGMRRFAMAVFALTAVAIVALLTAYQLDDWDVGAEQAVLLDVVQYVLAFLLGVLAFRLYDVLERRGVSPPAWVELAIVPLVGWMLVCAGTIPSLLNTVLMAPIVLVFAFEAGRVSTLLCTRPLQRAGELSYSIYLMHPLCTLTVYYSIVAIGRRYGVTALVHDEVGDHLVLFGPYAMDLAALICAAMVVALATLTYRFVERPFLDRPRVMANDNSVAGTGDGTAKVFI